jgi:endonuclease-8
MPEGHTLRRAVARLTPLLGRRVAASAPHARGKAIAAALDGRVLEGVQARGKHLLVRFEGGRVLHSHLRMRGAWDVQPASAPFRRPQAGAWLVLRADQLVAIQYGGPVLELLDERSLARHPTLARLGPDLLDDGFDPAAQLVRLRRAGADASIADLLLDQSAVCGIGNVYKCEALHARLLDPWARVDELADEQLVALYAEARRLMADAVEHGERTHAVYGRRLCGRCRGPVARRAQGDDGRTTHWCPRCQPRANATGSGRR